ncbi:MAG: phage/plasmid primase, P4 family [Elusimicrobiales bacterium]
MADTETFFAGHIEGIKRGRNGQRSGKCPFHDDRQASFSFNVEDGVWTCHAGCGSGGLKEFARKLGLPAESIPHIAKVRHEILAAYDYKDEQGDLLFQMVRYVPKDFRQRRPDGSGGWIWNLECVRRVPYRLPELIEAMDRDETVFIVEGEKDVETLRSHGFTATCNPGGAGKWRDEYSSFFTEMYIAVIPDNDEVGRKHARQICKSLAGIARSVKLVELPGVARKGEDVSDWISAGHSAKELIALALNAPEYSAQAAEATQTAEATTGKQQPDTNIKRFFSGKEFLPNRLAEELQSEHRFLSTPIDDAGRGVRLLVYRDGVYESGESSARNMAHRFLLDRSKPDRLESVCALIRESTKQPEPALNTHVQRLVCVGNGMVDWRTDELLPHSPDYHCTFKINADYLPDARDAIVGKFLQEVFPPDALVLAEELLGYLVRPTTKFQKAFMLTGFGANGKSTFLSALISFLGAENVSHVGLQDFSENRFALAELQGKLLNCYPDLPSRGLEQSDIFKALVSGDTIKAERKHAHPFVLATTARLIFSANELPRSKDTTNAFFRRWLIIPFPNTFEGVQADRTLVEKLTTPQARAALLGYALRGLRRLEEQQGFSDCVSVREAGNRYRKDCDSAFQFAEERLEKAEGRELGKAVVYEVYKQWCEAEGLRPVSVRNFNKRLADSMKLAEGRAMLDRQRQRVWIGVWWSDEQPVAVVGQADADLPEDERYAD